MRASYYVLLTCGVLVVSESATILMLNKKRGSFKPTHQLHVLSVVLYCIFLSAVLYSLLNCNRSSNYCDKSWKTCCSLYNLVTMSVYSFYWVKSRLVHSVMWKGKKYYERMAVVMIAGMGVTGFGFLWLPIKGVQFGASLEDGECQLHERRWIGYGWVVGDTGISLLLLMLFIRPLRVLKSKLADSPRSVEILFTMIRKNRNLLLFTVFFTFVIVLTSAIIKLEMRTCIYVLAVDRLVTLQCITMTFSWYLPECQRSRLTCWKPKATPERHTLSSDQDMEEQNVKSLSIIHMAPTCSSTGENEDTTPCTVSCQFVPGNSENQGPSSLT